MEDTTQDATVGATEVKNIAPASQESITVTLTDDRVCEAVRWWDPRVQKEIYEVIVDEKLYLGRMLADGKVELL